MRSLEFIIPKEYDDLKVIKYLRSEARLSSRLVNTLKRVPDGITLNGEHIRTIDKLHEGDKLSVNIPDDEKTAVPDNIPLDIIYEDDDILVIDKPAGLAMHPTHNHIEGTLANGVSSYFLKKGENVAFRAVGRLDKGTSGIVVCALNKYSASALSGKIQKTYYAVVGGKYEGEGEISAPIIRPDPLKTVRAVGEGGDKAVTYWKSLWTDGEISLLEIKLGTGRTHQIRVHFSYLGTPLLGDDLYNSEDFRISRPALHCGKAELTHPVTGEKMEFSCPLPRDIAGLLDDLI